MTEPFRPADHGTGIVHIGPGAFHRAHQAVLTQDAMAASGGDWRITGVSLRSTAVADALNAQGGRYTLVIRGDSGTRYRDISAIAHVHAAARGLDPIMQALTRPQTRIVSLTVTEKAYHDDSDDAEPQVIALLTKALDQRRVLGLRPFTLLSCDNLPDNGAVLKAAVMQAAARVSPELCDWLDRDGRFPATMVDRITPATTPDLPAEVAGATGFSDQVPVETEDFCQWVITDDFVDNRPDWGAAGVLMVTDVAPYEQMKLGMLNGAHSMLAYAGHLTGKTFVRDVMADDDLAGLVARHMDAAAATLDPVPGVDLQGYRDALLARFRNPYLAHETYQIAMDGSQKLPQRIFAPASIAAARGQDLAPFAFACALWLRYVEGRTDDGRDYRLRDPLEPQLKALPRDPADRVDAMFAMDALVPPSLRTNDDFRQAIIMRLAAMHDRSVAEIVRAEAAAIR